MIILNRESETALARLVAAARDSLKGGDHDGRCVWNANGPEGIHCIIHAEMLERRRARLQAAIDEWDALP